MSIKNKAFALFNKGLRPSSPDVKALGLASKTVYNYFQLWKKSAGIVSTQKDEDDSVETQTHQLVTSPHMKNYATLIRFHPIAIDCAITPTMLIAKKAAVEQWGWPEDMPWDEFFTTIVCSWFKDRGMVLKDYIVEE